MSIFDAFGSRWNSGDDVVASENVGEALLGGHRVREGTRGRVVEYRERWLGEDEVTVQFDGGQTEIVRPSEIRKPTWW